MNQTVISVSDLVKTYQVTKKRPGLRGSLVGLFRRERETFTAVDHISFQVSRGEIVGYIGPNGAGKSTTIKMMCGILTPTSGSIEVCGHSPQQDRKQVVQHLGVVFGQRSQLQWDLRLGESFELLKRIYCVEDSAFRATLDRMDRILGIRAFIDQPVRQLSLGQRMRGDLAAAMLRSPQLLFLDEPTIGLDVEVKHAVRDFIKEINAEFETTIILTTHDLADISELCSRIIILSEGKIIEDDSLDAIIRKVSPYRRLVLDFASTPPELHLDGVETESREGNRLILRFDRDRVPAAKLISDVTSRGAVRDLRVVEPDIEDIIREIYRS